MICHWAAIDIHRTINRKPLWNGAQDRWVALMGIYLVGVVLVRSCPSGELSGWELFWWEIVLVGSCPSGKYVLVRKGPAKSLSSVVQKGTVIPFSFNWVCSYTKSNIEMNLTSHQTGYQERNKLQVWMIAHWQDWGPGASSLGIPFTRSVLSFFLPPVGYHKQQSLEIELKP